MGSNASVLQWHCKQCTTINPTERSTCLKCGARRRGYGTEDALNATNGSSGDSNDFVACVDSSSEVVEDANALKSIGTQDVAQPVRKQKNEEVEG